MTLSTEAGTDTAAAAPAVAPAPPPGRHGAAQSAFDLLSRWGLAILLLLLLAFFAVRLPDSFATLDNARAILGNQSVIVIAALGLLLTLIVGEIDLSVAANLSLANTLVVGLSERQGLPVAVSIALAVAASTLVGLVNGIVVIRLQVNAFVGTLGMATFLAGMIQLYLGGTDLFQAPEALTDLGRGEAFGLPLPIFYAAAVAVVLHTALRYMPIGRRMLAVGGNARAAEFAGIPAQRYRIGAFAVGGLIAGLAGVVLGATTGSATTAGNPDLLLPVFAAALLGSTTVTPGRFNVPGLLIAVFFLAVAVSGLQQMGVAAWIQPTFNGAALVAAVALSGWATRARVAQARRTQLAAISSGRGPGDAQVASRPTP